MPATLEQPALPKLTNEEIARYSRHLILPEVGMEGQQKLKAAKVLCVGTGGLGAPMALYLAAAGIGTIGLRRLRRRGRIQPAAPDHPHAVHRRQAQSRLGARSCSRASTRTRTIVKHNTMLTSANALEIFKDYDIIADGTDNFQTRYLVNDACVLTGKPNVYGSIFRFEGQASVFATEEGPCYRCLYPEPPPPGLVPSCAEGGVLGILPGLVGVIQATEVIKLILGIGEPLVGRLLLVDALGMGFRTMKLRKNPECPMCGTHEIKELIDYDQFCGIPKPTENGPLEVSAHGAVAELPVVDGIPQMTVEQLKARIDNNTAPFILDVREPHEYQIVDIGAPLIPVGDLPNQLHRLTFPKTTEIVVHCKSGARSPTRRPLPQGTGLHQRLEPLRRHPGLGRSHRQVAPQVLSLSKANNGPRREGRCLFAVAPPSFLTCYNKFMHPDPTQDEANIRAARAHSNRSIARRNLLGVGDSLAEDFVAVIGDGSFVSSRAEVPQALQAGLRRSQDVPQLRARYGHGAGLRKQTARRRTRPLDRERRPRQRRLHRHLHGHVGAQQRRLEDPFRALRHARRPLSRPACLSASPYPCHPPPKSADRAAARA